MSQFSETRMPFFGRPECVESGRLSDSVTGLLCEPGNVEESGNMSCKRTLVDTAIFEGATMRRLEIGPGTNPLGGFDSLDVLGNPTYRAEWGSDPLPIEDESYDYVYASHCIEHVPWYRTDFALSEVSRILKPGGVVEIHTVDFALLVKAYRSESVLDAWTCHGFNEQLEPLKWVASRLFAYQKGDTQENWHRAIFDEAYLKDCLLRAGFGRLERCDPPVNHHGIINLGMRGVKPKRAAA